MIVGSLFGTHQITAGRQAFQWPAREQCISVPATGAPGPVERKITIFHVRFAIQALELCRPVSM
jgi:hypothetical protein